jgi:phosphatidylglycerol---prolipoprotein diacylglyceryl transferase
MHPILICFGPVNIYSWGFMVAVGCLAALFVQLRFARLEGVSEENILDLFVYIVLASIVGARLFYIIGNPVEYIKNPLSMFFVQEGGLVFLGGFIMVFITVVLYSRTHSLPLMKLLDILSPATMLGYGIGRIGCYLNGCCYGIKLFGFVQPTQVYSSIAGFAIFAVLSILYKKKKYDGQIFLYALSMYSIYRFLIEFLRYSPFHIAYLTLNQLLALSLLIVSVWTLWKKNSI